jgi:alanine racemase
MYIESDNLVFLPHNGYLLKEVDMNDLTGTITWAEIDLDAFSNNLREIQKRVNHNVSIIAVVKANAYGHGAIQISKQAEKNGVSHLAVHRIIEGIELRKAGIKSSILILGYTPPESAEEIIRWRLTPSVYSIQTVEALSHRASETGLTVPVHVKIDTGMNRYGIRPETAMDFLHNIRQFPNIHVEGIYTHLATADSENPIYAVHQVKTFHDVLSTIKSVGWNIPMIHAANSAAVEKMSDVYFTAVRPGILLYGLQPSSEWASNIRTIPVMTLKSRVCQVKVVPPGGAISYGRTFMAKKWMKTALIPVGYGDGYHRALSNKGFVLIKGHRAPILGTICMDQMVVNITWIPGVQPGQEAVLFGKQGNEQITAEEVADWEGTINYEVTTSILPRVTRLYKEGDVTKEYSALVKI